MIAKKNPSQMLHVLKVLGIRLYRTARSEDRVYLNTWTRSSNMKLKRGRPDNAHLLESAQQAALRWRLCDGFRAQVGRRRHVTVSGEGRSESPRQLPPVSPPVGCFNSLCTIIIGPRPTASDQQWPLTWNGHPVTLLSTKVRLLTRGDPSSACMLAMMACRARRRPSR